MKKSNNTAKSVSEQLLEICENDEKAYRDYKDKLHQLVDSLEETGIKSMNDLSAVLPLHWSLMRLSNRKARYAEEELAKVIVDLPFKIRTHDQEAADKPQPEVLRLDDFDKVLNIL